jgi:hypothetical protein
MPSLHQITRDTRRRLYCGPTAICAITGLSAKTVLEAIDARRGAYAYNSNGRLRGVTTMTMAEVSDVLNGFGYPTVTRPVSRFSPAPTLAQYLAELAERHVPSAPRIIRVRGHFMAVGACGRDVCDTRTKDPVPAKQSPRRRARVLDEIIVYPNSRN